MALIFSKSITNLTSYSILGNGTSFNTDRSTWAVTVYGGSQPSASTIASNWTSYNSNFLLHIQNVVLQNTNINNGAQPQIIGLYTVGISTATAYASGTGTWCIIWPTNPTQANILGATITTSSFLVCNVSDGSNNGMIKFTTSTFVAGSIYSVADTDMSFTGGI